MSYEIGIEEPVGTAVRRIAREQSDKATSILADRNRPVEWRIHQLRKRCKKLRALVRLVRPRFNGYKTSNARFRDIARALSDERDARIMADLVASLAGAHSDRDAACQPLVRWFRLRCSIAEELAEGALADVARQMTFATVEIERWKVDDICTDDVSAGFEKTFKRVHKAIEDVGEGATVDAWHELRKRCKYHRYHLKLLRAVIGKDRLGLYDELDDVLGNSHDRSVLLAQIEQLPRFFRRSDLVHHVVAAAIRERRQLRCRALQISQCVLRQEPDAYAASIIKRWMHRRASLDGEGREIEEPLATT